MAQIGHNGVVTNTTKQGGLTAAYYFGAMWGCFIGGWAGDKYGRKKGVWTGTIFCMVGAALMGGSINANMFICARVIAGIGIGFINAIIPPWVSELARAHNRGSSFSLVFVANCEFMNYIFPLLSRGALLTLFLAVLGIIIAYWINFGVRGTNDTFRWRFPLLFMIVPVLIVAIVCFFMPDSPRWLIANGKKQEAIDVLAKVRGDLSPEDPALLAEVAELEAVVELSHHKRNDIWNLCIGRYSGRLHLGRRVVLGLALQQIQQWTGILAIATWATALFSLAGFSPYKASWLAGLVNSFGVLGTAAASLVIDRLGRVKSLMVSFVTQGISLFLVAAFMRASETSTGARAEHFGIAAAAMVFVFLWFFTMFNIVPCWIYGTEIWPQEIRAKGYSFTIFGWAVGCGMTGFVIPIMLSKLGWKTFIVFGVFNFVSMPLVWFLYPEVAGKTLEEVNLLFTSESPFVGPNMKEYHRLIAEANGNVSVAERRLFDSVDAAKYESDEARRAGAYSVEEGKTEADNIEVSAMYPSEKH